MKGKVILVLAALACAFAFSPAMAGGGKPTLYERYVPRIADKPKIEPRTYSQVPQGRKAEEFYTCGDQYCGDGDTCCTNQYDWSSYCWPGGYRCDSYGGCW